MSRFRKMITAVCTLALVAGVFSGALLIHFRASAAEATDAFMMDALVSDTVQSKGETIEKEIADVQLLHGAWGSYTKFDTFYDAAASGQGSNAEDMVSDSQSLASAGDHQEIKTYIKRYQLSAIQGNDLVMKFTFKQNAELKETHAQSFDRNWTNQGYFYWVVEPGDGSAVTLKEQLAPGETIAENALAYTVHAKAGDTVYFIYRMKGETNVPGHDYVNVMLDFRFDLAVGNYNAESRQSALDGGTPLTPSTPVEDTESFNMSAITSATVQSKGEPIEKEIVDVQLLHGAWGSYTKFDTFYDAAASGQGSNAEDMVSDSGSKAAGTEAGTFFKRYQIGAIKENDAVMKFTFKQDAKFTMTVLPESINSSFADHATVYVIQVAADGTLTNIMIEQGKSSIAASDYACVVHAKAGDTVYRIFRMTGPTTTPGHEYAIIGFDFTLELSTAEYDEEARTAAFANSVEDPYAGGAGEDKTEETEFILSDITSATVQSKGEPIEKEIADVQLLHGKWGEYAKFDTFYDAIANGDSANNNDKVSDSASNAAGLGEGVPGTYFTRGIIGATKDNDAVVKFTFKKNAKVNIQNNDGFWPNQYDTHARLYVIQVAADGTLTNIMIKQGKSTISKDDYSCFVHAMAGDTVYLIFRMTNEAAIPGNDYANFAAEFEFRLSEENYDAELRQYAFEHSVEELPEDPGTTPGGSDVPLPPPDDPDLDIDTPDADNSESGCGSVVASGLTVLLVLSVVGLVLVRRKRGGKRGEN